MCNCGGRKSRPQPKSVPAQTQGTTQILIKQAQQQQQRERNLQMQMSRQQKPLIRR